ncbi:unnamed protein product [Linum tenue]|uniref:Homer protein n=1 Tax=Linum tenue TaxID=586396 RepID=A0AAV0M7F4_9ROSI|nr:unnamed protein product [Linum tenue]
MAAKQAVQSYYHPVISRTSTAKPIFSLLGNKFPSSPPLFSRASSSFPNRSTVAKCSGDGDKLKDALSGMVGKQVEQLLGREENKALLDELEKASERVEIARRELAEIERQELEAKQVREYVKQLEIRAGEIEECLQEISAAKSMVEEAERSLSAGSQSEASEKDKERIESVKAAGVCALVGTLAGLPVSLTQATSYEQLLLPLAVTFLSCALFGVTFRYVVRRDLDDSHLKTGAIAAFGFVKGLGRLSGGAPLELNPASILSHGIDGAVYVSQSLLVFGFAAVSLDYCFKVGIISPFPLNESPSETNAE